MSDSDQEKYSIDEMMNRLKSRGEGGFDGEPQLVTREDGSQVMRVRKRKRRSRQPHKEAEARQRKRTLLIAAFVTLLLVGVGLGIVGWIFYLNGSGYRSGIESKISAWTGGEVKTTQFRATPVSIGASEIELTWTEDHPAARLNLRGITGNVELASHFGTPLSGEQLTAARGGELVLRVADPVSADRPELPVGICPFDFNYRVNGLNITFGQGPRPAMVVSDTEASFVVPELSRPSGNLVLQGGHSRIPGWGSYDIDFASLQLTQDGLRVGNLELIPEGAKEAEIRLGGDELPPVLIRGGVSELRLRIMDMPSLVLLGNGLGRIVDATFETPEKEVNTARFFFDVTDPASLRAEAPIQTTLSSNLRLHHLQLFNTLALEVGNDRLAQARFETEARANLKRSSSETRLENISLVSQGLIRIEGKLAASSGGKLDGVLEVGLPDSTVISTSSRALPEVFNRQSSGHRWASVRISGTADQPADDLAEQLKQALVGTSPASGGQSGLEDEFIDLTTPE